MTPTINNQMYEEFPDAWWDESNPMYLLKSMVNPWRVPYFKQALLDRFGSSLGDVRLLDVGCGGGVLAEEFARQNCQVIGIDVASASISLARHRAQNQGLSINYQTASAICLPFKEESFDVVCCCDALEHIVAWEQVLFEVGRVLKPGGLFFFDTINRTSKSRITFITGLQDWHFSRLFPARTHVWEMFITPQELQEMLLQQGLTVISLHGGAIPRRPLDTLLEVWRFKRGRISAAELGDRLKLEVVSDLSLNYLGVACKNK